MDGLTTFITSFLSFATMVGHVLLAFFIISLFMKRSALVKEINKFLAKYAIHLSFFIMIAGSLLSLYYSEVAGFIPCTLCWWQRIFIYSAAIILGISFVIKERKAIVNYVLGLAIPAAIIAAIQYYGQMRGVEVLTCSVDATISCSQIYTIQFNYITIPMMSLTALIFVIIVLWLRKKDPLL